VIRLQGLTEKIHPSGLAIFIAGKNCGLFRGNYAWPCSITMPANFAPEKVIHPATAGAMSHQKIIMAASHINSSPDM